MTAAPYPFLSQVQYSTWWVWIVGKPPNYYVSSNALALQWIGGLTLYTSNGNFKGDGKGVLVNPGTPAQYLMLDEGDPVPADCVNWVKATPSCGNQSHFNYYPPAPVVTNTRAQSYEVRAAVRGTRQKAHSIKTAIAKIEELESTVCAYIQTPNELPVGIEAYVNGYPEQPAKIKAAIKGTPELACSIEAAIAKNIDLSAGITASVQGNPQVRYHMRGAIKGEAQLNFGLRACIVKDRTPEIYLEMENVWPQQYDLRSVPNASSTTKDWRNGPLP